MIATVELPSRESIEASVEPNDSILDLKYKIREESGIRPEKQTLFYRGEEVYNDQLLVDISFNENVKFQLIRKLSENPCLYVKDLFGKIHKLAFVENESVLSLRKRILKLDVTQKENFLLMHKDEELDEISVRDMLVDYDVSENSLIELSPLQGLMITIAKNKETVLTLNALPNDTVYEIKQRVNEIRDIPHASQRMFFNGDSIKEYTYLYDHKIKSGATLSLLEDDEIILKIKEKSSINERSYLVKSTDSIKEIKEIISLEDNVCRTLYDRTNDVKLMDEYCLLDYKVICEREKESIYVSVNDYQENDE